LWEAALAVWQSNLIRLYFVLVIVGGIFHFFIGSFSPQRLFSTRGVPSQRDEIMATKLVIASGKSAGKAIAVKRDKLLIGRAEECDIRPLSDEVSRRHCAVRIEPGIVWVEDLGSRNGTFVNGQRIAEKTRVYDDDLIKVGGLELRVAGGTAQEATAATAPKAAEPASWNDEDEVSRWLLADSEPSGIHDTTQTAAAVPLDEGDRPVAAEASTGGETVPPNEPPPASDSSSVTRMSIEELKASRANPGGLPKDHGKAAGSSREAAAEALRKLFGNRS
jgi:predicted component of type VI protein secretion system